MDLLCHDHEGVLSQHSDWMRNDLGYMIGGADLLNALTLSCVMAFHTHGKFDLFMHSQYLIVNQMTTLKICCFHGNIPNTL
jgi:hypothetical protein